MDIVSFVIWVKCLGLWIWCDYQFWLLLLSQGECYHFWYHDGCGAFRECDTTLVQSNTTVSFKHHNRIPKQQQQ
jgi:hypothetical protein